MALRKKAAKKAAKKKPAKKSAKPETPPVEVLMAEPATGFGEVCQNGIPFAEELLKQVEFEGLKAKNPIRAVSIQMLVRELVGALRRSAAD